MLFNSNKISNVLVYNSITNTLLDDKFDTVKPFSFIEFLNYTKSLNRQLVEFDDYQVYLKKWNEVTTIKYNDLPAIVRQEFISFLKTIALNYTTSEEKRFLSNIDYQNRDDLEVAAPFFSAKIKEVCLYFAEKRDSYNIDLELARNKGSVAGLTSYIKTQVLEIIYAGVEGPPSIINAPLTSVNTQLQVEVEEGYDIYNNYFDLDPFEPPEFYNATGTRAKYFTSNTNVIDKEVFLDYNQAIINLINSEEVVLSELQSLVVNIDTPDLNLLQSYDFINYSDRTRNNLKLLLNAELAKKFTGTDYYYLSTNSSGVVLSGVLFEAKSPFANLLNVYNPTTLTVPESSILFERDVGLFFKPSTQSILQLQSPFSYAVKEELRNDFVYIFPDPFSYGNIVGLTKTDHESPFVFVTNGDIIQRNISSNNALGNSFVTDKEFTFESYHSQEQNSVKSVLQNLYNCGVVYSYISDIFGNIYAGFKQVNTEYLKNFSNNIENNFSSFGLSSTTDLIYLSSIVSLISSGTFANTQSISNNLTLSTNSPSIYATRTTPGNFLVYNIFNNTVNTLSSEFENIFDKYPTILTDIQNNLINFEVYGTSYVMTTSSYVVIDKLDYNNGEFLQTSDIPLVLTSSVNNKVSNSFLVNNELYIVKVLLTEAPLTSGNNNRQFTLLFYSYDTNNNKQTQYAFANTSDNNYSFDINTFVNVTNVNLIYNKKQGLFNVVITLKDLSNNIFIYNIFLRIANGVVNLVNSKLFGSTNVNLTVNFYDNSYTNNLILKALSSAPIISNTNGTITF